MCRIMLINDTRIRFHDERFRQFADICRHSPQYQGHGWGACWWEGNRWREHHSLTPIWDEREMNLPATGRLLIHARSAFEDRDIVLENNMPFLDEKVGFAFNGELHGVRLRMAGRTGARRILNLIQSLGPAASLETSTRARSILVKRTRLILGMNWIVAGLKGAVISSHFGEREDYYTMHMLRAATETVICSAPLNQNQGWLPMAGGILEVPWWLS